jgi:hypothetical protein
MANKDRLPPIHPGEILREEIPIAYRHDGAPVGDSAAGACDAHQ